MPGRMFIFGNGEYYHVFNRGVARQPIFSTKRDYEQALLDLQYYSSSKPPMKLSRFKELPLENRQQLLQSLKKSSEHLIDVIVFALMPNHFHLLLRQRLENGIPKYLSLIQNSYTRYFNTKHKRTGPIFQGVFKAIHIETEEQLLHVSRYIHLNPVVSFLIDEKEPESYTWSSLSSYLNKESSFLMMDPILGRFKTVDGYRKFILDQVDYAKKLHAIKHLLIEKDVE